MVISFIPNWARNSKITGFFRFPEEVHRDLFAKEIAEVIPQNVCFEKPALAEQRGFVDTLANEDVWKELGYQKGVAFV